MADARETLELVAGECPTQDVTWLKWPYAMIHNRWRYIKGNGE